MSIIRIILLATIVLLTATGLMAQTQAQDNNSSSDRTADETTNKPTPAAGNTKSVLTPLPKPQPQSTDSDEWHFRVSPYFWIAGVTGRAGIGSFQVDVDSGITDSNVKLNSGFMGTFEARKNKFFVLTDLQYSNLGTERPNPGILFSSASADFKTFILDPEVGYRLTENSDKGNSIDVLGGIRYWRLETNLNFAAGILPARSITGTRDWVDAVGGVRARIHVTPKFFFTGKADLGGGGSKFTYQLFGAAGYAFTPRFALLGGYRDLHVNYDKDNFLFDTSIAGPIVGVSITIK